jgi:hypothetical protein
MLSGFVRHDRTAELRKCYCTREMSDHQSQAPPTHRQPLGRRFKEVFRLNRGPSLVLRNSWNATEISWIENQLQLRKKAAVLAVCGQVVVEKRWWEIDVENGLTTRKYPVRDPAVNRGVAYHGVCVLVEAAQEQLVAGLKLVGLMIGFDLFIELPQANSTRSKPFKSSHVRGFFAC